MFVCVSVVCAYSIYWIDSLFLFSSLFLIQFIINLFLAEEKKTIFFTCERGAQLDCIIPIRHLCRRGS